jgi:hypothetical protein
VIFSFRYNVKTGELILGESGGSVSWVFRRLAAYSTIARGKEVSLGALSVYIDVMTSKVYNSFSFEIYLTCL